MHVKGSMGGMSETIFDDDTMRRGVSWATVEC